MASSEATGPARRPAQAAPAPTRKPPVCVLPKPHASRPSRGQPAAQRLGHGGERGLGAEPARSAAWRPAPTSASSVGVFTRAPPARGRRPPPALRMRHSPVDPAKDQVLDPVRPRSTRARRPAEPAGWSARPRRDRLPGGSRRGGSGRRTAPGSSPSSHRASIPQRRDRSGPPGASRRPPAASVPRSWHPARTASGRRSSRARRAPGVAAIRCSAWPPHRGASRSACDPRSGTPPRAARPRQQRRRRRLIEILGAVRKGTPGPDSRCRPHDASHAGPRDR